MSPAEDEPMTPVDVDARPHALDNAGWHALTTVQSSVAEGSGKARRYLTDVSVFSAIEDDSALAWSDLAELTGPTGVAVLFRAAPVVPPSGWRIVSAGRGHQMILRRSLPDLAVPSSMRALGADDVPQMIALVELTKPGPFRPRTPDLGGYVGIFDGDTLVAMAGQRISVDGFTEISAVCTHPDARRRGYAGIVTVEVARNLLGRGITPFLHVAETNVGAYQVYERLGFTSRLLAHFVGVEKVVAS